MHSYAIHKYHMYGLSYRNRFLGKFLGAWCFWRPRTLFNTCQLTSLPFALKNSKKMRHKSKQHPRLLFGLFDSFVPGRELLLHGLFFYAACSDQNDSKQSRRFLQGLVFSLQFRHSLFSKAEVLFELFQPETEQSKRQIDHVASIIS